MVYAPTIITMTLNEYLMVRENAALLKVHRRRLPRSAFYFILFFNVTGIPLTITMTSQSLSSPPSTTTTIKQQYNKTTTILECSLKQL